MALNLDEVNQGKKSRIKKTIHKQSILQPFEKISDAPQTASTHSSKNVDQSNIKSTSSINDPTVNQNVVGVSETIPGIKTDTGYQNGYRVSETIPGIKTDTGYQNGYRVSETIPGIKTDTGYQNGYRVSETIPGIKTDTGYQNGYRVSKRIPGNEYPTNSEGEVLAASDQSGPGPTISSKQDRIHVDTEISSQDLLARQTIDESYLSNSSGLTLDLTPEIRPEVIDHGLKNIEPLDTEEKKKLPVNELKVISEKLKCNESNHFTPEQSLEGLLKNSSTSSKGADLSYDTSPLAKINSPEKKSSSQKIVSVQPSNDVLSRIETQSTNAGSTSATPSRSIEMDTRYQNGYPVSEKIPGIEPDTRYQNGYRIEKLKLSENIRVMEILKESAPEKKVFNFIKSQQEILREDPITLSRPDVVKGANVSDGRYHQIIAKLESMEVLSTKIAPGKDKKGRIIENLKWFSIYSKLNNWDGKKKINEQ